MSAIAGWTDREASPSDVHAVVEAMHAVQTSRGIDGEGVFSDGNVAFAHRRLAVVSAEKGGQPLFSEDRKIVAVADGFFYGFRSVRARLEEHGHAFSTESDAEILVHLYEEKGIDAVRELDGMFSFALLDGKNGRLYLVRDRLGKKPLFFRRDATGLAFASTLDALRRVPGFTGELDRKAISDFLSFGYVPHPRTIYEGVEKLPPAHYLAYDLASGSAAEVRYWKLSFAGKSRFPVDEAAAELRRIFENAVAKRLEADAPPGIFLSGGVDSFLVAATAAKQLKNAPCDFFTIGFSERGYDESAVASRRFARIKAINPHARHHVRIVDPDHFKFVGFCSSHYGEPFADASMIPTHLLCAITSQRADAALSGDGADELFGGYDRYRAIDATARFHRLSPVVRQAVSLLVGILPAGTERTFCGRAHRFVDGLAPSMKRTYFNWLDRAPEDKRAFLYGRRRVADPYRIFSAFEPTVEGAEAMAELDLATYLPDDALTKIDVAASFYGLEVRSPFLDDEMVDFAAKLPWHFKIEGKKRKKILGNAFPDLLPRAFLNAKKRGFGVPVALWLRSAWKNAAQEELLHGALARTGLVDPFGIRRLWSEHLDMEADHSPLLWHLLILSLFLGRQS